MLAAEILIKAAEEGGGWLDLARIGMMRAILGLTLPPEPGARSASKKRTLERRQTCVTIRPPQPAHGAGPEPQKVAGLFPKKANYAILIKWAQIRLLEIKAPTAEFWRMTKITNEEFDAALPTMQKLLWATEEDREKLQGHGLNLIPANFYSSVPSISEISNSFEYHESTPPYLDSQIFDQEALRAELAELIVYSSDFTPSEIGNEDTCVEYFWRNSQFSYSDAMSYYAYVRRLRPRTIVEIGSGFSSLVALEALRANGGGRLKCIEPFPRPFISTLGNAGALDLLTSMAQDIDASTLNNMFEDGDILFIDSTHTVKSGSDCLHIYLRLLPKLTKKILVHVHDVFLPFGLPKSWMIDHHIYWTEQYLLLALLTDNPRTKLLFGSAYHKHFNADLLSAFMRGRFAIGGGSFWFEYDGRR